MRNMKRRDFIAAAASAAAAGTAALAAPRAFGQQPVAPNAKPLGANSDIRIATIGLGGQGKNHTGIFSKIPGVRYVAVCDCDTNALEFVKKEFEKKNQTVATYTDFRKMLENKEIDAVTVASPNHWHALMGIMIMQSGKDAFVEKPVSHNIFEGQRLVEAQKYYNRICQGGTQRRSDASLKAAIKALQAGELGKIKLGRAIVYRRRQPIGMVTTPQQPPASVNYDLWCGPAQMLPIMRKKFHYDWHWFWNWGNGEVGNNIIHMIDVARWAVGAETLPKRVMSIGGKFGPQDSAETPNTQMIYYEYDGIPMIAETRGLPLNSKIDTESRFMNAKENALIHCEGGYYTGGWMYDAKGKQIKQFKVDEGGSHYANFINAVRSRKQTDLNAPIAVTFLSTALCHVGNLSYRVGKAASPDAIKDMVKSYPEAQETFGRFLEHLSMNSIDIKAINPIAGPWLDVDAQNFRFTGPMSEAANKLLTRDYRKPYVVPEKFV